MRTIYILILSLFIQTLTYAQQPASVLAEKLTQLAKKSHLVGFGVAVYTQDRVLYQQGFGCADKENKQPYTSLTTQKIASVSKVLLGVALMKAQELQQLKLDDSVNDYLPFPLINPYQPQAKITIRHLATHTAGLKKTRYDLKALYFPRPIPPIYKKMPWGLKRLIYRKLLRSMNRNKQQPMPAFLYSIYHPQGALYRKANFSKKLPGEQRIYSNNGAALLALVIEKASGMSYTAFIKKHILQPLGMAHTYFDFQLPKQAYHAMSSLYQVGYKIPNDYQLITYPAGGLVTNVEDFTKFMMAIIQGYQQGNQLLSHKSFQEMMTLQLDPKFKQGILWKVYKQMIGHNGDIAGVITEAYFYKKEGVGYLFFCNTADTKNFDKEISQIITLLEKDCLKMIK